MISSGAHLTANQSSFFTRDADIYNSRVCKTSKNPKKIKVIVFRLASDRLWSGLHESLCFLIFIKTHRFHLLSRYFYIVTENKKKTISYDSTRVLTYTAQKIRIF